MQDKKDESRVPDAPQIKSDTWFALAIAGFLITLVIFVGVAIWIFTGDPGQILPRAQAFTPFGGALIAVVTFFTIAWRGVLNTKQLEYQATQIVHQGEQLSQTRRQNDAKDDENLARLLMDGTKLLGDEKEFHVLAGVAALQAVVTSPRGAFASQAMDILVDLVERTYNQKDDSKVYDAAREAVNLGAAAGRKSSRRLRLAYDEGDQYFTDAINGVELLTYRNAIIRDDVYSAFADLERVRFQKSLIEEAVIDGNHRHFRDCDLQACNIKTMNATFLTRNTFENCDFSGAKYTAPRPAQKKGAPHPLERLKGRGNWFAEDQPIVDESGTVAWERFLDKESMDPIEFETLEDDDISTA
ncbi:hypothetical protein E0H56_03900 [Rhizobium leguminosarum bv. viciae]|jgi:uncharacterized protein YjbI with pentapeptide repeats|uniref:hypothetical protein n=1 Tax=Rhizobium leguminosarum TaxID=384 RepID=UPI00104084FD|nr:hypothetical protein [Rhizobium leguminosarum]TBZ98260.1 hypothetical protein E0H56_03900 [Rhizobium leguminosarum bv. viciae]